MVLTATSNYSKGKDARSEKLVQTLRGSVPAMVIGSPSNTAVATELRSKRCTSTGGVPALTLLRAIGVAEPTYGVFLPVVVHHLPALQRL
jgi:hypothetical protein